MNRLRFFTVVISLLLVSADATAAVISRDWKASGDGLLTYDDVNRREWLDLSQTILSSQFPIMGAYQLETRELRYQYVVSQTGLMGAFAGFTVGRSADVLALANSVGIDTASDEGAVNMANTQVLINLLGISTITPSGTLIAEGLLDEFTQRNNSGIPLRISSRFYINSLDDEAGLGIFYTQASAPPGVMLYRAVPEPTTIMLVATCLMGVRGIAQ